MASKKNPNHPKKGSTIKVEPIRDRAAIKRIKKLLSDQPRNTALFTLGINTAFRASDLVALDVSDVVHLSVGDVLERKEQKTKKYRATTLNQSAYDAINAWLAVRPPSKSPALFNGQRGRLTVPSVNALVKLWCRDVGLRGNYGSHTLRKTWGYMLRTYYGVSETLISEAFGHSSVKQTRTYLGIQSQEITEVYMTAEL